MPTTPPPLDSAAPEKRKLPQAVRWLIVGCVGIAGFLMIAPFVPTSTHHSREQAYRSLCRSNLHQIGLGIIMYCNNHGGTFPDSFQALMLDTPISPAMFVCPSSNDAPTTAPTTQAMADDLNHPGHISYIYLGRGLTNKSVLPNQIIAYEPLGNHSDGIDVLLGDGNARFVESPRAGKIISDATAGKNPVLLPP